MAIGALILNWAHAIFKVTESPSATANIDLEDQAANQVLAGPASGGPATPSMRALVAADIAHKVHGPRHGEGEPDDLVDQNLHVSRVKIKDVDPTPVDDLILKVLDGKLRVRNSGDTVFKEIRVDQVILQSNPSNVGHALRYGQLGGASGVASLDASAKVVENPANAQTTAAASKIPIADGAGQLDAWVHAKYTDAEAAAAAGGGIISFGFSPLGGQTFNPE